MILKDRTGNPLTSLATAAEMEESGSGKSANSSGRTKQESSMDVDSRELERKMSIFRQRSTECLLHASRSEGARCDSDDSDSDSEEDNEEDVAMAKPSGRSRIGSHSSFPRPDFEIFQQAPPTYAPPDDDAGGEFERIRDLGTQQQQQRAPDGSHVREKRTRKKAAKRAAAASVFAAVAAVRETTPSPPSEAPIRSRPSSTPLPTTASISPPTGSRGPVKMIGKLTPEERKKRIAKFMDKRTRRRWGRKVEYECRKKLAVQRVRVHGRFA